MRNAVALLLLLTPTAAVAQPERYELGRRLRQFEADWEKQTDPAIRKKALEGLPKLTGQFFGLKFGEAGRTLDDARFVLAKEPPTDTVRWLTALCLNPEKRLVDATTKELSVVVKPFYPVPGGVPAGATATVRIGNGRPVPVPLDKLPATLTVPFPDGAIGWAVDWPITLTGEVNGKPAITAAVRVSTLHDLAKKLKAWKESEPLRGKPTTLEAATSIDRMELFAELADGSVPETDLPVVRLNHELERFSFLGLFRQHPGFNISRPGLDWVSVPPAGKGFPTPCRLFVPNNLSADKPVPLVVALHGAGGTENLFVEGYGAGRIVTECADRGWLLVSPRCGFTAGPPVDTIVDRLAERYPIDRKRVFVVGHSMGAAQAVGLLQKHPGLFAAAGCLGGGGRVTEPTAFAKLPVYVGVGEKDFALAGAKGLAKALTAAGAAVTLKEYPDLEHLMIVREALPAVFAGFDAVAGAKASGGR